MADARNKARTKSRTACNPPVSTCEPSPPPCTRVRDLEFPTVGAPTYRVRAGPPRRTIVFGTGDESRCVPPRGISLRACHGSQRRRFTVKRLKELDVAGCGSRACSAWFPGGADHTTALSLQFADAGGGIRVESGVVIPHRGKGTCSRRVARYVSPFTDSMA